MAAKNFLKEARERRINRPEGLMYPCEPVAKKEVEKIEPADYHTMIRNFNEYAKIPKLITI